MEEPGFWDDTEKANASMKELKNLRDTLEEFTALETSYEDIYTLIELAEEEEDASVLPEVQEAMDDFTRKFDNMRIRTLLSGEYDKDNAILKLNAGAGGTEACDWCSMLFRMYSHWCDKKGFSLELLDQQEHLPY